MPPAHAVPPWRTALAAALQRGSRSPAARYLQLATRTADGAPRNRSVVFRGFGPASELLIYTDARSGKIAELLHDARAELCWYLAATREQFRLQARVAMHGAAAAAPWDRLRAAAWRERGARGQSEWLGAVPEAALLEPVDHFVVLAVQVHEVLHLQLRQEPHCEDHYRLEDARWHTVRLRG